MLKVENLNVHYGVIHAIEDVSIEVNDGEIVTLIGANGLRKNHYSSHDHRVEKGNQWFCHLGRYQSFGRRAQ